MHKGRRPSAVAERRATVIARRPTITIVPQPLSGSQSAVISATPATPTHLQPIALPALTVPSHHLRMSQIASGKSPVILSPSPSTPVLQHSLDITYAASHPHRNTYQFRTPNESLDRPPTLLQQLQSPVLTLDRSAAAAHAHVVQYSDAYPPALPIPPHPQRPSLKSSWSDLSMADSGLSLKSLSRGKSHSPSQSSSGAEDGEDNHTPLSAVASEMSPPLLRRGKSFDSGIAATGGGRWRSEADSHPLPVGPTGMAAGTMKRKDSWPNGKDEDEEEMRRAAAGKGKGWWSSTWKGKKEKKEKAGKWFGSGKKQT
ncbi:hypothetical protein HK101_005373 [Irineochytrium annulatum]|nr:hypothetical protein HK101_005373 [Irineochytrium annulatum]